MLGILVHLLQSHLQKLMNSFFQNIFDNKSHQCFALNEYALLVDIIVLNTFFGQLTVYFPGNTPGAEI